MASKTWPLKWKEPRTLRIRPSFCTQPKSGGPYQSSKRQALQNARGMDTFGRRVRIIAVQYILHMGWVSVVVEPFSLVRF
eukprot:3904641-Amphidinium_carterae.1